MAKGGDPFGMTEQDVSAPRRPSSLRAGTMIGEYELIGLLGEGGFGHVYHAVQPLIGKEVAIKVLKAAHSSDDAFVSRFIAEARAVNKIGHPNIINIFSFGQTEDDRWYFVMDLLEGNPLKEYMQERGGRLSPSEAVPLLRGIADALDAAHDTDIVHRDLKPANVFVESSGSVKLLDFGIAKSLADDAEYVTVTGSPIGTPVYMSPEQTKGKVAGASTDVYSLGVMTYQILTGKLPITGDNFVDIANAHASRVPAHPCKLRPALGPVFGDAVMHMLEKEPADRPPSAGAAISALEQALDGVDLSLDTAPTASRQAVLADTALAGSTETHGSGERSRNGPNETATESLRAGPRLRVAALVATGLAVAAVAAFQLTRDPDKKDASSTAQSATPVAAAPAAAPADASIAAAEIAPAAPVDAAKAAVLPTSISITVTGKPSRAIAYGPGNQRLGSVPGRISLDRADQEIRIEVRRSGYVTSVQRLTPDKDQTLRYELRKKVRRRPKPRPPKRTDLEDEY